VLHPTITQAERRGEDHPPVPAPPLRADEDRDVQ